MDRWELYAEGKIPKPTGTPQLWRVEPQGDFVIEAVDRPAPEVPIFPQNIASLISGSGKAINRRRGTLWRETCPVSPPLIGMQIAAVAFLLVVVIPLLGLYLLSKLH